MEENPFLLQRTKDEVHCPFQLVGRQAVQGSFFKHTIHFPIRPLFHRVYSLPPQPALQVAFLTLLLVYQSPAEVRSDQFLVAPAEQRVQHCAFAASQLKNAGVMVDELGKEVFQEGRLHVPIVDLLLLQLISGVPVAFDVIVRQVLWKAVLDQKLLVFAEFCQLVLFLHLRSS